MHLTIITEDDFGKSVASLLQRSFAVRVLSLKEGLKRSWKKEEDGIAAICTDRPYPMVFETLADAVAKADIPFTSAHITDAFLIVGPLIVPGKSACYRCYQRRMRSHSDIPIPLQRVIESAFNRDWALRSPGILSTTPLLAAARIARHVSLDKDDYGMATRVALIEPKSVDFRIRRVHGCKCLPLSAKENGASRFAELISRVEKFCS